MLKFSFLVSIPSFLLCTSLLNILINITKQILGIIKYNSTLRKSYLKITSDFTLVMQLFSTEKSHDCQIIQCGLTEMLSATNPNGFIFQHAITFQLRDINFT